MISMLLSVDVKKGEKFSIQFKPKVKIDPYLKIWLEQDIWQFNAKGRLQSDGGKKEHYDYVLARILYGDVTISKCLANVRTAFTANEKVR